jgi:hypothetical protein
VSNRVEEFAIVTEVEANGENPLHNESRVIVSEFLSRRHVGRGLDALKTLGLKDAPRLGCGAQFFETYS